VVVTGTALVLKVVDVVVTVSVVVTGYSGNGTNEVVVTIVAHPIGQIGVLTAYGKSIRLLRNISRH
jgi:hypothetical protein